MSNKNRKILIVLINNNLVVVVVFVVDVVKVSDFFVAQDHKEEISNKNVQIIDKN